MMEHDEKIKLMVEAMMTNVELIERNTRGLDAKALKKELQALSKKVASGFPDTNSLEALEKKVTAIQKSLKSENPPGFSKQVSNHHYLWFFPDFKEWLQLARRGLPIIVLSIVSLLLAGFITLKYPDYQKHRNNSYKYQYLYYATQDQAPFQQFEREWGVDSIKLSRIQWVDQRDALLRSEIHKVEEIQQLQERLDSLQTH